MDDDVEKTVEADVPETQETSTKLAEQKFTQNGESNYLTQPQEADDKVIAASTHIDSSAPESVYENPATLQTDLYEEVLGSSVAAERNDSLGSQHIRPLTTQRDIEPMSKVTHNDTEVPIHDIAPCKTTSCGFSKGVEIPTSASSPQVDYINRKSREQNAGKRRRVYLELMKTFEGVLFVGEILCSLLSWILLVVWNYADVEYRMPCPLGYSLFAFVASFVTTTIWFVILLTGLDAKCSWMAFFREPPFGMAYNVVWALAYLIAGGIAASYAVTDMTQVLGASTSFAFIVFLLHVSHALVYFYRRFGLCPWQLVSGCNKECSSGAI